MVTGNSAPGGTSSACAAAIADPEIRAVALACLRALQEVAGNVFDDFRISALADGTEVAASPYVDAG